MVEVTGSWIAARLEGDNLQVTAYASAVYGYRKDDDDSPRTVTVSVPVDEGDFDGLRAALVSMLEAESDDLQERVVEAAHEHRIIARRNKEKIR